MSITLLYIYLTSLHDCEKIQKIIRLVYSLHESHLYVPYLLWWKSLLGMQCTYNTTKCTPRVRVSRFSGSSDRLGKTLMRINNKNFISTVKWFIMLQQHYCRCWQRRTVFIEYCTCIWLWQNNYWLHIIYLELLSVSKTNILHVYSSFSSSTVIC